VEGNICRFEGGELHGDDSHVDKRPFFDRGFAGRTKPMDKRRERTSAGVGRAKTIGGDNGLALIGWAVEEVKRVLLEEGKKQYWNWRRGTSTLIPMGLITLRG